MADQLRQDPEDAMRKYRAVFALGEGVAWPKSQSYNAVRGTRATTAEEWVRANLV